MSEFLKFSVNFSGFCSPEFDNFMLISDENVTDNILTSQKIKKKYQERFHTETIVALQTYTKPLISMLKKQ